MAGGGLATMPTDVLAHGAMEVPLSRIYLCFKEGPEELAGNNAERRPIGSPPCIDLVKTSGTQPLYDWTEVNRFDADGHHKQTAVNGHLCSGGREKYYGLDQRRADWPTTKVKPDADGKFTFRFHATTPHAVKYFRFYVTKDGWKPTDELTWKDIEQFAAVKGIEAVSDPKQSYGQYYNMTVKIPEGKTGRRLIFAVWQRSDSPEAFYSCSDVKIAKRKAKTASAAEIAWEETGQAVARNDLPAGTTVAFRVFDAKGGDVDRIAVKLTAETGAAAQWPSALAEKVNAKSQAFRIGVESDDDDSVAPQPSATANRVYRSSKFAGYSYVIDVDTP